MEYQAKQLFAKHGVPVTEGIVANTPEEARAALTASNPQKRLIQPAEVTAAALWLCAPGSEGINGQAIAIAGGET